ncbi:unnamed protein product, partial [Mesorhabditis spiculigera]
AQMPSAAEELAYELEHGSAEIKSSGKGAQAGA